MICRFAWKKERLVSHGFNQTLYTSTSWINKIGNTVCLQYGYCLKEEEDFVEVRFDRAFKNADAPNYFSPIFVYADGRAYTLPIKIMQ